MTMTRDEYLNIILERLLKQNTENGVLEVIKSAKSVLEKSGYSDDNIELFLKDLGKINRYTDNNRRSRE